MPKHTIPAPQKNDQHNIQGRLIRQQQTNPECPRCGAELGNKLTTYTYYQDGRTQAHKIGQDNSSTGKSTYTVNQWGFA